MNIAYVRVSSFEQNEERQIKNLERYNIEKWFNEKASAKDTNRAKFKEMLEFMREGDTVFVHDFSRLARSTKDLLDTVELFKKKKVNLVSSKENIDTTTATGKLMLTMIAAIYEFERMNMLDRQREGIAIAKQKGRYKGRKKIDFPDNWLLIYTQYKHREITAAKAMEILNLKKNTFYNLIKEHESKIKSNIL